AAELLEMEKADQAAREPLETAFSPGAKPDSARMVAIFTRLQRVDSANLARLKEMVREHGWPDAPRVGPEAAQAVFLLVQHADRDVPFQKEYLGWLESAYHAGLLPRGGGQALALLTDRVRTAEGRPQLYGSQVDITGGRAVVKPIEDAEHVDVRRAALGLPPLAEYLAMLREMYHLAPNP
ncbi:MAG TPA: DUF6624 domain-containing protein, partial [Longimicrobiaceae bacterium]|nr:DUF6624 domain-containing protein [Longimicrobiaceae bacterium]